MNRTTQKRPRQRIRWTDFGDFSVHFGDGVVNINNRSARNLTESSIAQVMDSWLNSYQYFLFRRAIYGLEVYSQEELRYISSQKKKRIMHVHQHALDVINLFKQRVLSEKANRILGKVLYSSRDIKVFISINETDPEFQCELKLESLGIQRMDIARELVEKKCLPYNFWDLTTKDDPRMIKLRAKQEPLDQK